MYILELYQDGIGTDIGIFETIEDGREFICRLPGYDMKCEDGYICEYINAKDLNDYLEIEYKNNIIPFSRFMFPEEEKVKIFWKELPNLSLKGKGMVAGLTKIDAYVIENNDVKKYIEKRENAYKTAKQYLENKGYTVTREFHGSEDGEAILYKKSHSEEWHFLTHLDPTFLESEDVIKATEDMLLD